ncbi:fimbrial protein [Providencia sneebia]|uniref:Fimbrial protein n=1 Tax=Providencia sneebia DSM 19967 TaxID=1141660 RepID=K8WJY6_9GAMM|nr:fimbrial protein [Providencia sneebia]EKT60854.1 fimbrial protein [Providencia sneebia DSM 19967]
MKKIKQVSITFLILFMWFPTIVAGDSSVRYEFSVLFLAKTCDIDVPSEILLGNQLGITTANEIKNDSVVADVLIRLKNCSTESQSTAMVYLSSGNTLNGSNNFFNDDPNGVIGVQLLDGSRVIDINNNPLGKPSPESIIWDNIESTGATKTINAKLRCAIDNCDPNEGDFSATLTIGYYAD